jgi:Na+-driven multidrug efflux pump
MAPLHDEMVLALRIYSIVPITNGMMRIGISVLQALRKAVVSTILSFMRETFFLSFYWIASKISMEAIYWSLDLTNVLAMTIILTVSFHYLKKTVVKDDSGQDGTDIDAGSE